MALVLGLAAQVAPARADTYAAIAYSEQTRADAWAYDTQSAEEANQRALSSCKQRGAGCQVVASFSNSCAALAVGVNNRFAASQALNKQQAESEASNACRIKGGDRCDIKVAFCANPPSLGAKPGLWQFVNQDVGGGQARPAVTVTHCIKPQDIAADHWVAFLDTAASDPACNRTDLHSSTNSIEWKFVCNGQASWIREGSIRFDSQEHYTGTVSTKGKPTSNAPSDDVLHTDGKWVGTCTGAANGAVDKHE